MSHAHLVFSFFLFGFRHFQTPFHIFHRVPVYLQQNNCNNYVGLVYPYWLMIF
uniref:Uncharacterized protein n=1 Tax=Arundo donax TaxID=35708 RepID=A0A0A8YHI6_ARUDO